MNLNFRTVPLVESGLGKISILSDVCNQLNIKKPLIITDQGLFKLGFVEEIEKSLSIKNISSCVYNRVKADPPESNIFEAVNFFKDLKVSLTLPIFLTFLNIPSILFDIFPFIFLYFKREFSKFD